MKIGDPERTVRMPPTNCPRCGSAFDAASTDQSSEENPRSPRGGDLTICAYCAVVLVFGDDLRLRLISRAEMLNLPTEAALHVLQMQEYVINTTVKQRVLMN